MEEIHKAIKALEGKGDTGSKGEKGKGKGHGPIWMLSVSAGTRQVRQIPVPAHLKQEVEEGVHRYAEIQKWLKQISGLSLDLLEERKKR